DSVRGSAVSKFSRALAMFAVTVACMAAGRSHAEDQAALHPELWPKTHSPPGFTDEKTEAFVSGLMSRMSLEEKVGQVIQDDITTVNPEDLRKYPLGSILAGGDSAPRGDNKAPAKDWVALAHAFRTVSMEARPDHTAIPVIFGIDAVHGHNNIVGATIF